MTPPARSADDRTPSLRITSPAAVVGAIPYLLGFPPERSLVALVISGGFLRVTARADLPPSNEHLEDWGLDLVARLRCSPGESVLLVVYPEWRDDHHPPLPGREAMDAVRAALGAASIDVIDALLVSGERWWSFLCGAPECCPVDGRPVATPEESLVRSVMVFSGKAPVESREALAAEFAVTGSTEDPGVVRERQRRRHTRAKAMGPAHHPSQTKGERAASTAALIFTGGTLSVGETLDVLDALTDIRVRDAVLWDLSQAGHVDLWHRATSSLHTCLKSAIGPEVAPVATVLAIVYWQLGDGARAGEALRRAAHADPGYGLSRLIETAIGHGLPPTVWRQTMSDLDRATCLGESVSELNRTA